MQTVERLANWIARKLSGKGDEPDMLCGDCPRGAHCGSAPTAECLTKLEMRASGQSDLSAQKAAQSKIMQI